MSDILYYIFILITIFEFPFELQPLLIGNGGSISISDAKKLFLCADIQLCDKSWGMIITHLNSKYCDSDRTNRREEEHVMKKDKGEDDDTNENTSDSNFNFSFNQWLRAVISRVRCELMTAVLVSKYSHSNPIKHTTKRDKKGKLLSPSCHDDKKSSSHNNSNKSTNNTDQTMNGNSEEKQEEHVNVLIGSDDTPHTQTHTQTYTQTHTQTHKQQKLSSDCLGNCAALDESNFSIGSLFYGRVDCVYEDSYDVSTGACAGVSTAVATGVSTGAYGGNSGNNSLQRESESSTLHDDHDNDNNNDINGGRRRVIQRPNSFTICDRHGILSGNQIQGHSIASQSATNVHTSISTNSSTYSNTKKRLKLPSIPVPVVKSQHIQSRNDKKSIFNNAPALPSPLSLKRESPNSSSTSTATSTPTSISKILGNKKNSFSDTDISPSESKEYESTSRNIEIIRNGKISCLKLLCIVCV